MGKLLARPVFVALLLMSAALVGCQGQLDPSALQSFEPTRTPTPASSPRPTATSTPSIFDQPSDPPGTVTPTPRQTPRPTNTPVRPGPSPSPTVTPTAPAATPTTAALPTPHSTPTPHPGESNASDSAVLFGPVDGRLQHYASSDYPEELSTGVHVENFVATTVFQNPDFTASVRNWNYGFWFRVTESDGVFWSFGNSFPARVYDGLMLLIDAEGNWTLYHRQATIADQGRNYVDTKLASGFAQQVKREAFDQNTLSIIAVGETGWLAINGSLVAELDFGQYARPGNVLAVTGAFENDEFNGSFTGYAGLTVRELSGSSAAVPASGELSREQGQTTRLVNAMAGDFFVRTDLLVKTPVFTSPWSWSLVLESDGQVCRLVVDSSRRVTMTLESDDGVQTTKSVLFDVALQDVQLSTETPNAVRIIVQDDVVNFMINGFVLPAVQLGAADTHGLDLSVYVLNEPHAAGQTVTYSDLGVWQIGDQAAASGPAAADAP